MRSVAVNVEYLTRRWARASASEKNSGSPECRRRKSHASFGGEKSCLLSRQNADGNLQFRGQADSCAAQRVRGSGREIACGELARAAALVARKRPAGQANGAALLLQRSRIKSARVFGTDVENLDGLAHDTVRACAIRNYFFLRRMGIMASASLALLNDPSSFAISARSSPSKLTVTPFAFCL